MSSLYFGIMLSLYISDLCCYEYFHFDLWYRINFYIMIWRLLLLFFRFYLISAFIYLLYPEKTGCHNIMGRLHVQCPYQTCHHLGNRPNNQNPFSVHRYELATTMTEQSRDSHMYSRQTVNPRPGAPMKTENGHSQTIEFSPLIVLAKFIIFLQVFSLFVINFD